MVHVVAAEFKPAEALWGTGFVFLLLGVSESIRLGGEILNEGKPIQLAV